MVTIKDIRAAQKVLRQYLSPAPLLRSFKLEKKLGLDQLDRRVYIKDYGWTPVGRLQDIFAAILTNISLHVHACVKNVKADQH